MTEDFANVGTGIPGNDLPPKRVSLSEVGLGVGGAEKIKINAFLSNNLGNRTLTTCLPLAKFYDLSIIANDRNKMNPNEIAQRPLDENHAKKLGVYILKGLVSAAIRITKEKGHEVPEQWFKIQQDLGTQVYEGLQPVVVNIRECSPGGTDLVGSRAGGCWEIELEQAHKLWVVDGQHRRKGMQMMFEFLDNVRRSAEYPKRGLYCPSWLAKAGKDASRALTNAEMSLWETCDSIARLNVTIAVEIHLGLNPEQERQLFHDMNRLVKKMDNNLALDFDTSNPINRFSKEVLAGDLGLKISDEEVKDWDKDNGSITRKDVTSVNSRLFLNKTNINGATNEELEQGKDMARRFWEAVLRIPGFGEEGAHKKTVAAQPVVLKALAKLANSFVLAKRRPENGDELFDQLLSAIDQTGPVPLDFSHENPMWRYYEFSGEERIANGLAGLEDYLPSSDTGNRDIGQYQAPYFRFGAKHNDIFPIIGDMIRWKLGLPNRNASAKTES